jgi:hypothetical protein
MTRTLHQAITLRQAAKKPSKIHDVNKIHDMTRYRGRGSVGFGRSFVE